MKLVKENLNESKKVKLKLPRNFQICHRDGKNYVFEYTKYNWQPDLNELNNVDSLLKKYFSEYKLVLKTSSMSKLTVYTREGDVTIGAQFTSTLDFDKMEELYPDIIE
jgi:methyltransferase-like protein